MTPEASISGLREAPENPAPLAAQEWVSTLASSTLLWELRAALFEAPLQLVTRHKFWARAPSSTGALILWKELFFKIKEKQERQRSCL